MKNIIKRLLGKDISEFDLIQSIVADNLKQRHWTHIIFMRWNKSSEEWVFDIPIAGISDEPFVDGMPEIIEHHLLAMRGLENARKHGVAVLFSGKPSKPQEFAVGHYFQLLKLKEENGGCRYKDKESGFEGWLCPNLYKFFATAPKQIHICIR